MTRINANIPVKSLLDAHIIAEHREITRVCSQLSKQVSNNKIKLQPKFKLGSGHRSFFLDKGAYLFFRYSKLRNEINARGFNCDPSYKSFKIYESNVNLFDDYKFSDYENDLVRLRIACRYYLMSSSKLKYYGMNISIDDAISKLDFMTEAGKAWVNILKISTLEEIKVICDNILTIKDLKEVDLPIKIK